jgi:5-formyltetrahydrofolate cyclo-ligase
VDPLGRAKQSMRSEMDAIRRALSAEARRAAGESIARHVLALPEYARAARGAAYRARAGPAPTPAILDAILASGRTLLLPRAGSGDALEFAAVRDVAALVRGRYGIAEPAASLPSERLAADDLVLVPGVAFDATGGRLGRGVGFYDRSLPRGAGSPPVFGVAFACQLVAAVPMAPHDRRLDGVVTESGVVR